MCETSQESIFRVELRINDEKIELNSFVEGIISQTIIGMVKPLRGVGEVETLNIKVSKKA